MVAPGAASFDPEAHLYIGDIAVDNSVHPQVFRITIKQSKIDPFRRGVDLFVGRTGTDTCPVVAMLNYLVVRGMAPSPVFIRKDGTFLT